MGAIPRRRKRRSIQLGQAGLGWDMDRRSVSGLRPAASLLQPDLLRRLVNASVRLGGDRERYEPDQAAEGCGQPSRATVPSLNRLRREIHSCNWALPA